MKASILAITLMALFSKSPEPKIKEMVVKESWNKNQVIAHRGAWKKNGIPENSIASLKEAIRLGCFGSEFDVHMTADSILVINHDAEFLGLPIAKLSYQELLAKKHSNGEDIPTLEAYLREGMKQKRTKLILELKPSKISQERDLQMTAKAVAMVKKLKAEAWVDYISFSYEILKQVKVLQPKANVAYLNGDASLEKLKADGFYGADYNMAVYKKGEWFEKARELGLTINAWTVNTAEDMKWFLDNKADFITTNEPELLFEVLKTRR
jgi:glycerophosphoryl diester phosphodiesterase